MSEVVALDGKRDAEWDAYLESHPEGTIFHLTKWKRAVEKTFGHRAVFIWALEGNVPVGVLPLFLVNTLKGKALVSVPYAVYGGVVADRPDIAEELLAAAQEIAARYKCKYIEMRKREANELDLPETDLYVTFGKELPESPEACLASVPRKSRAAIRNGRKKFKLRSEFTNEFDTLHDLYALNVRRLGSPVIPFSFLTNLRTEFGDAMDVQHVLFEDRVVCCVLNFWWRDMVVPFYSGSDLNYFFTQCNNVMYCDLMEEALRRGARQFDFGRSRRDTGPYSFKVNMGFEPKTLHYQYVLLGLSEVPKINPANPMFELPRRIWSHLPLAVTKLVGPQLLKYIP
jgi:FemAB-related protein (PEP-CTERM system-associated)